MSTPKRHGKKTSGHPKRGRPVRKRTLPMPLSRLSRRSSQARTRALHVIAEMRRDKKLRLSSVARSVGVKPSIVRKYFGSALHKVDGSWCVRKSDRFSETMYVPDNEGNPVPVPTKNFKQRKEVSAYVRDIGRFSRGKKSALTKWRNKSIAGVELVTDPRVLLSIEAQLSDFSIYNAFNGGAE